MMKPFSPASVHASSVRVSVCPHSHAVISWSIFAKSGREVKKSKNRERVRCVSTLDNNSACYAPNIATKRRKWACFNQVSNGRRLENTQTCVFYFCHFLTDLHQIWFLTARRYASAVLAVIVCLSVCPSVRPSVRPSVCLSQVEVVQRWLNLRSD